MTAFLTAGEAADLMLELGSALAQAARDERGAPFNLEGGCYAKVMGLSAEAEPEIFRTTRRFGTVLENVVMDPETRVLDLDDATLAGNTRAVYPIDTMQCLPGRLDAPQRRRLPVTPCDSDTRTHRGHRHDFG